MSFTIFKEHVDLPGPYGNERGLHIEAPFSGKRLTFSLSENFEMKPDGACLNITVGNKKNVSWNCETVGNVTMVMKQLSSYSSLPGTSDRAANYEKWSRMSW